MLNRSWPCTINAPPLTTLHCCPASNCSNTESTAMESSPMTSGKLNILLCFYKKFIILCNELPSLYSRPLPWVHLSSLLCRHYFPGLQFPTLGLPLAGSSPHCYLHHFTCLLHVCNSCQSYKSSSGCTFYLIFCFPAAAVNF